MRLFLFAKLHLDSSHVGMQVTAKCLTSELEHRRAARLPHEDLGGGSLPTYLTGVMVQRLWTYPLASGASCHLCAWEALTVFWRIGRSLGTADGIGVFDYVNMAFAWQLPTLDEVPLLARFANIGVAPEACVYRG